jgi:hypothetical protein
MKHTMPAFLSLMLVLLFARCGEDIIDPPPPVDDTPPSHDFEWKYTIIEADPSWGGTLRNICYINDTCIWAVGEIVRIGPEGERLRYNAVRWDGREWVLEQVYDSIPGQTQRSVHRLYAVYGDRPDNIWFSTGALFIHWDGTQFSTDHSLWRSMDGSVFNCWGSGPDNIYMGGTNGELVHYDGRRWRRIENDIPWPIMAMHGKADTLLLVATDNSFTGESIFYTLVEGRLEEFWNNDSIPLGVEAVWFGSRDEIFADGPYSYQWNGVEWRKIREIKGGMATDMAANAGNDILVCGAVCTIRHFNGETWRQWERMPGIESAKFWRVTMQDNEAWIVGRLAQGNNAVIVHGTRSP